MAYTEQVTAAQKIVSKLYAVRKVVLDAVAQDQSILNKVMVSLGQINTDQGVPVLFDGDVLAENVPVFTVSDTSPDPVPLTDGTYTLEDGRVIDVMGGVCVKITEAAAATGETTPSATEQTKPATTPAANTLPKSVIERHEIETMFAEMVKPLNEKIEALTAENTKLKEDVVKMGAQESTSPAKTTIDISVDKKPLTLAQKLSKLKKVN